MAENLTLAQHRERFATALESLRALEGVLWQATSSGSTGSPRPNLAGGSVSGSDESAEGLAGLLGQVDALGGACDAARVAVTAEAVARGESSGGAAAMTVVQWVLHHAPTTRAGGARQLADVAGAFAKPANAAIKAAVDSGRLPVRSAAAVVAEADKLRPLLAPGAEPPVLEGLIALAADHGPRGCRQLRPALLAKYGRDGQLQLEQDQAKRFVALSQPIEDGTGIAEYRLSLDPEGKAALEAALGPLSAPRPAGGERDLRTCDQRRGEALISLVRRAVAAGEAVGTNPKAQLFVTMDWESLSSGVRGAGRTLGGPEAGALLAPETVRPLSCDASLIPVLLGSAGEVLDQGRSVRFFTAAQTRRLWLRDGGCTYPGCSMPPHWADAHHLVHWSDFGPSDLGNADCCASGTTPLSTPGASPDWSSGPCRGHGPGRRPRHAPRRRTGRMGSHPRLLRPAAGPAGGAGTSVIPARTPARRGAHRLDELYPPCISREGSHSPHGRDWARFLDAATGQGSLIRTATRS